MRTFAVLLSILLIQGCFLYDRAHPPDNEMIANFEAHEAEFDQLVNMCREDPDMSRIANDFLWTNNSVRWPRPESDWGISRARWDAYKKLFAAVDLDNGLSCDGGDIVFMFANNQGIVPSGSSKGYAYLSEPPEKAISSLDEYSHRSLKDVGINGRIAYRPIKENWYLFIDRY